MATRVPGAANPQAFNRYMYTLGNPLKYTDPTGHYCVGDDEDCADEAVDGPAPTGTGGNNGGGGRRGGGSPHDDDDIDPNPNNFTRPPVCSSSMCNPNITQPFPTPSTPPYTAYRVAEFFFGAVLFGLGAVVAIGGGFIVGAAIAEVFAGVATGPLEGLVVLHALAVGTVGTGVAIVGVTGIVAGFIKMKDALTP